MLLNKNSVFVVVVVVVVGGKGAGTHRLTTGEVEVLKIIFKCVTVRGAGTPYRFVPA